MRSLGIDPSVTATGLVVLEATGQKIPTLLYEKSVTSGAKGLHRCSEIAGRMIDLLDEYQPERVVIEGYAFSNKHTLATLVELGTVLRYFLLQMDLGYIDASPGQLKKFVSGNGSVKKSKIMLHVFKRWGHEAPCEDTADAYGLACIGLAHGSALKGLTQPMLEVTGVVKLVN